MTPDSRIFLPAPLDDAEVVSALGLEPGCGQPATLPGHRLSGAGPVDLPGLAAEDAAGCDGTIFSAPSRMVDALDRILAAAGCRLETVPVAGGPAIAPWRDPGGPFDADAWRGRALPVWRAALPDLRALTARFSPADLAARLPMILSRADSRARALADTRTDRSGLSLENVVLEQASQPYTEYFAVNEYILRHAVHGGGMSEPVRRAVFMAADAVTVLPYDPIRDRVMLVEQFRAAPFARGDRNPWLMEPVAGRIEPGDTPEETAHKEALEEAGLRLGALHRIGGYYPSTGCFSEYLISFVGIADLPDDAEGLHGLESEGEDIRTHLLDRRAFLERITAGEMPDGPLLLSAYWLELNKERLQRG